MSDPQHNEEVSAEHDNTLGSHRVCPVCTADSGIRVDRFCHEEWDVCRCSTCGFVYLRNPPGYEALVEKYAWEKTSVDETKRRVETRGKAASISKNTRWRLALLRGGSRTKILHYFQTGNVLDIGCGAGGRLLKAEGTPFGIEISRELYETANEKMQARGGYAVHAPAVEGVKQFAADTFDSVLMHSFLEHEESPGELLDGVFHILKSGGHAYVRVPNFGSVNRVFTGKNWCGFRYPDHVNYFTLSSLKRMASERGFRIRLLNPLNLMFDDNIKVLLMKP